MTQAKQLKQYVEQVVGRGLKIATIKYIHGNTITVQVGGSSRYLRNIPVVGGTSGLLAEDQVTLTEADGQIFAQRFVRS